MYRVPFDIEIKVMKQCATNKYLAEIFYNQSETNLATLACYLQANCILQDNNIMYRLYDWKVNKHNLCYSTYQSDEFKYQGYNQADHIFINVTKKAIYKHIFSDLKIFNRDYSLYKKNYPGNMEGDMCVTYDPYFNSYLSGISFKYDTAIQIAKDFNYFIKSCDTGKVFKLAFDESCVYDISFENKNSEDCVKLIQENEKKCNFLLLPPLEAYLNIEYVESEIVKLVYKIRNIQYKAKRQKVNNIDLYTKDKLIEKGIFTNDTIDKYNELMKLLDSNRIAYLCSYDSTWCQEVNKLINLERRDGD